jgi:hypothetical protein
MLASPSELANRCHIAENMSGQIQLKKKGGYFATDTPQYRIQLFTPRGAYPKGTYCNPKALFHADEDMVFAVTHGCRWANVDHLPYNEVDWMEPEVVRLLGSMILAEDTEEGLRCRFYPLPYGGFEIDDGTYLFRCSLGHPKTKQDKIWSGRMPIYKPRIDPAYNGFTRFLSVRLTP